MVFLYEVEGTTFWSRGQKTSDDRNFHEVNCCFLAFVDYVTVWQSVWLVKVD